jgi:hypothetical protein
MQIDNISVNVELVSNTLVSGGAFNGIPAYYSYASNVKRNWTFTVYISLNDYNQLLREINFFGYNLGEFESVKGNITSVSINSSVYTKGKEYFLASVNLTEFPDYAPPNFDSSFEESYQISIAGYYVNGSGFLGNDTNSGTIKTKSYTKQVGVGSGVFITGGPAPIPVQAPGGSSNPSIGGVTIDNTFKKMKGTFSEIVISSSPSNFRYIIDDAGAATLYADFKDTILLD